MNVAVRMGAIKRSDLREVVANTAVQPGNVARPADARLLRKARERLLREAGPPESSSDKVTLSRAPGLSGAAQVSTGASPPKSLLVSLRTDPGRVTRDIGRRIDGNPVLMEAFREPLRIAERVRTQRPRDGLAEHVHSVHAPEVECIGKGNRHRPREFGVKVSVAILLRKIMGMRLVLHVKALPGRPRDRHTPATVLPDMVRLTGVPLWRIFVGRGCKVHNAAPEYEAKVIVTGRRRNTTPARRRKMSRRNAVEPVIGPVKNGHRMGRN